MPKVLDPPAGTAVKETRITEIIPSQEKGEQSYDPFQYMENLKAGEWSDTHVAYIYRVEPPVFRGGNEPVYVGKYAAPFGIEQVQSDFGGGRFRILIRDGASRKADGKVQIAGTPRDLSRTQLEFAPGQPGGVPPEANNPTSASVVTQAMNMVSNPAVQNAQTQMLVAGATAAVDLVKSNAQQQLSTADIIALAKELAPKQESFLNGPFGPVMIAIVTKLVDKLFTDPTDQMLRMADLMSKFGGGGSSSSDWKAALVDAAPKLAVAVKDGLHELRLGAEAQQRAALPAAPPITVQPNPAAAAGQPAIAASQATAGNVVQMPNPPLPGAAAPVQMEVPVQFIWQKIFEMLQDGESTGEEIGEFLDQLAPGFIADMKHFTIDQVTQYVQATPAIAQIAQHPRFRQCLTELLAWANQPPAAPAPGKGA